MKANGYRVKFTHDEGEDGYFGSIEVESGQGSINSTYHRFNVTGNEAKYDTPANAFPIGLEKPQNAKNIPLDAWQAALETFHALEKRGDY